jgi:hypothetical protein
MNRYDRQMGCIGQAYFTYYGRYRDKRAGKMVVVLSIAVASLRHPLSTLLVSVSYVLAAFWPRAATFPLRTYVLHWAGALVHMAGRYLLTFCRRHVNMDAEKHTRTLI